MTSFSRTGPTTLRMMVRWVSKSSARTWVTPPREPVRPRHFRTRAYSTFSYKQWARGAVNKLSIRGEAERGASIHNLDGCMTRPWARTVGRRLTSEDMTMTGVDGTVEAVYEPQ